MYNSNLKKNTYAYLFCSDSQILFVFLTFFHIFTMEPSGINITELKRQMKLVYTMPVCYLNNLTSISPLLTKSSTSIAGSWSLLVWFSVCLFRLSFSWFMVLLYCFSFSLNMCSSVAIANISMPETPISKIWSCPCPILQVFQKCNVSLNIKYQVVVPKCMTQEI